MNFDYFPDMKKSDAIELMNRLGAERIPFLFIIDFAMKKPRVVRLCDIQSKDILYDIGGVRNYMVKRKVLKKIAFTKKPVTMNQYKKAFLNVMSHLNGGDTYLCNLTFPTPITTNLTMKEIFLYSNATYKLWYENQFVVFSPETFIKIRGTRVSSFPMKGTIDASIRHARKIILSDPKETAEHNTIVDLIRNDLSMIAKKVRVVKYRYVLKIRTLNKNLLQVSSEIGGILPNDYNSRLGEIIFRLLPAGSISGAPKKKTVEVIRESERYVRGYYTGIFGIFDGKNLDSGVMIRFIERHKGSLVYKSGGGITAMSDLKSEYREMIDKVYVPIV